MYSSKEKHFGSKQLFLPPVGPQQAALTALLLYPTILKAHQIQFPKSILVYRFTQKYNTYDLLMQLESKELHCYRVHPPHAC